MSKTSIKERNKAIRLAWEREQKLVAEGKGTRDWSQDQQKDILDPNIGKAKDANGRSFEGQHMKSAAEYPEYQGDPDNIQFLTRDEQLAAHKGSWQNPTNWYYNPETKEFVDFGENKPIPCVAISLSESVCSPVIGSQDKGDDLKESSKTEAESTEREKTLRREDVAHRSETKSQNKTTVAPSDRHESFGDKVRHVISAVKEFGEKHPVLTGVLKIVGIAAAAAGAGAIANSTRGSGSGTSSSSSDDYFSSSSDDDYADSLDSDDYDNSSSDRDYPDERSSPEEHTVPAHGQHYHTKDGVIWKEKGPYQRGGKYDD